MLWECVEEGGDSALPLMLLVHGWPDSPAVWSAQTARLRQRFRCVSVTLPCFPGSARDPRESPATFSRLLDEFDAVVERYRREGERIYLVAHDWGSSVAYMYERRYGAERVQRLVTLDVGPAFKPSGLLPLLLILAYQVPLLIALALPAFLGDPLTRLVAWGLGAPRPHEVCARANYLYWVAWRDVLFGMPQEEKAALRKLRRGFPEVPTLFVYGERSPVRFFSSKWLQHLDGAPDSMQLAYPCKHWIMRDQPERLTRDIENFCRVVHA